jgi:hypothetical protein
MSLNLHCSECDLWQTPTYVTEMCMVQNDGTIPGELTGAKARHALYIYTMWVNDSASGGVWGFKTKEEADDARQFANAEIEKIMKVVKKKKLRVWLM